MLFFFTVASLSAPFNLFGPQTLNSFVHISETRWALPNRVWRQSPWICVVFFGVAPAPFCVVSLFFFWRNANLAGRFAGRRCCRVFSLCFGLTMCLVYEAKVFHIYIFGTVFYRFLSLSGPSLRARSATTEKTKKTLLSSLSVRLCLSWALPPVASAFYLSLRLVFRLFLSVF